MERITDAKAKIKRRLKDRKYKKNQIVPQIWKVFKTPVGKDFRTSESQWSWEDDEVHFRIEHLLGMLREISDYLGEIDDE
jgi:hypothetical protein